MPRRSTGRTRPVSQPLRAMVAAGRVRQDVPWLGATRGRGRRHRDRHRAGGPPPVRGPPARAPEGPPHRGEAQEGGASAAGNRAHQGRAELEAAHGQRRPGATVELPPVAWTDERPAARSCSWPICHAPRGCSVTGAIEPWSAIGPRTMARADWLRDGLKDRGLPDDDHRAVAAAAAAGGAAQGAVGLIPASRVAGGVVGCRGVTRIADARSH